jgi:DNA-binding NtrC family response regulator
MGNPLRQWIDERWRPSLEALLRHAADAHGRGELCRCASDGLEVRVHLSASAIHDDGRQVYCLVATELGAPWHAEKLVGAGPAPMEIAEESQVRTLAVVTDQFEKEYVLRVLAIAKGKRGRCAELLGISRRGLWLRLRKFGITGSGAKA